MSLSLTFLVGDKLKQTRPGYHLHELEFPAYSPDKNLCPVFTVRKYLSRTKPLRGKVANLFISFVRPYKPVSKSTVSRWVKTTLGLAGVDLTRFKPHSIRAVSTPAASRISVPLGAISVLQDGPTSVRLLSIIRKRFINRVIMLPGF